MLGRYTRDDEQVEEHQDGWREEVLQEVAEYRPAQATGLPVNDTPHYANYEGPYEPP
jgi:hypothetical protein